MRRGLQLDRAGHVLRAAHRRLDHAMTLWAFRYLDGAAVVRGERFMDEVLPTPPTGHVYAHPALVAGVCRHGKLPFLFIEGDITRALYGNSRGTQAERERNRRTRVSFFDQ